MLLRRRVDPIFDPHKEEKQIAYNHGPPMPMIQKTFKSRERLQTAQNQRGGQAPAAFGEHIGVTYGLGLSEGHFMRNPSQQPSLFGRAPSRQQ